jgi:hypothetical protein
VKLLVATLCDFANVREGLLNVTSAGVTRVYAQTFPAPMNVVLALQLDVAPKDALLPHEITVEVSGAGGSVAKVRGGMQIGREGHDPDENRIVSFVLDVRAVGLASYGWYTVTIDIDGEKLGELGFKLTRPPAPPAGPGVRMAPPSRRSH